MQPWLPTEEHGSDNPDGCSGKLTKDTNEKYGRNLNIPANTGLDWGAKTDRMPSFKRCNDVRIDLACRITEKTNGVISCVKSMSKNRVCHFELEECVIKTECVVSCVKSMSNN